MCALFRATSAPISQYSGKGCSPWLLFYQKIRIHFGQVIYWAIMRECERFQAEREGAERKKIDGAREGAWPII